MAMSSLQPSNSSSVDSHFNSFSVLDTHFKSGQNEPTLLRLSLNSSKSNLSLRLKASKIPSGLTMETENCEGQTKDETFRSDDLFSGLKQNFLSFKRDKYLANMEHFQKLAESQAPKFTVIACADSRVCPSTILGFQPGEAFIVRNVANLVPPFEEGPSETKAALEFSVNSLQVENLLVIGHSKCGGIRALMSMPEEDDSRSFITSWVIIGKNARVSTKSVASALSFDQQCQHCEKESVNRSLINLLSYPWIKERVAEGKLSLHGGYYDFTNCSFEKWTLDYRGTHQKDNAEFKYSMKDRQVWR